MANALTADLMSSSTPPRQAAEASSAGSASDVTDRQRVSRWWGSILFLACLVALASSGYLAYVALTSSKIAGCGGGALFNCGHVISSQYSVWFGIPVSLMAVGLYLAMACSLVVARTRKSLDSVWSGAWLAVTLLAFSAGLAAIWFIYLQIFVLKHLCWYCLVAHTCGLVSAAIVLYLRPVSATAMKAAAGLSVVGLAALIGGQLFAEPPQVFEIEVFETPVAEPEMFELDFGANVGVPGTFLTPTKAQDRQQVATLLSGISRVRTSTPAAMMLMQSTSGWTMMLQSGAKSAEKTDDVRKVAINGGTLQLNVAQWPLVGSPDAKYIFVEMFDYACSHCRHTHKAIKEAKSLLGDDVAVVVLPVPMNTSCNDTVKTTDPRFTESCDLAKLAVSLWRVDADQLMEFHNWLLDGDQVPSLADATAKAKTLVDGAKLDADLASGISAKYVAKTVELYKRAGSGSVPKLIFPTTTVVGEFTSGSALAEMIRKQTP